MGLEHQRTPPSTGPEVWLPLLPPLPSGRREVRFCACKRARGKLTFDLLPTQHQAARSSVSPENAAGEALARRAVWQSVCLR